MFFVMPKLLLCDLQVVQCKQIYLYVDANRLDAVIDKVRQRHYTSDEDALQLLSSFWSQDYREQVSNRQVQVRLSDSAIVFVASTRCLSDPPRISLQ